ncbi:hypothetical protein HMPREF1982_02507 [Clostridiales bacterium oral taxon 876 str. F0540]|nr:hypothetical protein HMPREF1982_02507 [Clostridiales bacterium oral taxon 876 str. F0540]
MDNLIVEEEMINYKDIKDYLPIITTILAALLTYFFVFRKGKKDKFNTQIEEGLEEIISPMLHSLRFIMREKNPFQREKLIKAFFFKYSSEETKLYKMCSKYIVDWYYKTEDLFYEFIDSRKKEDWEIFWVYFYKYNIMINEEYKSIRTIIYSDYRWLVDLNQKNPFLRLVIEFFVLIYEMCKFIILSCFIFIMGFIVDNIQGKHLIPAYLKQLALLILFIFLLVYCILLMCLSSYASQKQMLKESHSRMFFQKVFPRVYNIWNRYIYMDVEKEKKKISIPDFYK